MLELWNLMDTPSEEQGRFQSVACNIAASEDEITEPDTLSVDSMHHVEAEVLRLESLKARRMKDLVLKKHEELKQIRRRARLPEADAAVDSGSERSLMILERLEAQISEARDLEYSRKDVLERMERWQAALDEESWLEEYSRNENRYNVGKGTHLVLKRAEKARALASRMPAMVEALTAKVAAWEKERGTRFEYDGERLLDLLEEYSNTRKEKEQERKRQRDQRRLQGPGGGERDASSPKNIKNVTRTLSMGGRKAPSSSRPGTPSFLKSSPAAVRRGGSDDGQMLSDSFE